MEIEEFASPDKWELFGGDGGTSIYMVRTNRSTPVLSNYKVTGIIHIGNYSSDFPAVIGSVTNEFSDGIVSIVSCPVVFPYTLNPGKNILCAFSV